MGKLRDHCSLLIPSWDDHTTCVKCRFSAGLCSVDVHNLCEVCRSWSPVTWSRLRKSLPDARQKSTKWGTSHWSCQAPPLLAWMESASTSSDLLSDNRSIADLDIREVDLELAAASAPTQVAEVSIHESSVVEPAIMTGQAPTMDIVSTVPLYAGFWFRHQLPCSFQGPASLLSRKGQSTCFRRSLYPIHGLQECK